MIADKPTTLQDPTGEPTTTPAALHDGDRERRTARRDRAALRTPRRKKLSCPFCKTPQSSPTNLWRHKAQCHANPNPTCPYCSWHYKEAELERHMKRCDYRDAPRPPPPIPEETAPETRENATQEGNGRVTEEEEWKDVMGEDAPFDVDPHAGHDPRDDAARTPPASPRAHESGAAQAPAHFGPLDAQETAAAPPKHAPSALPTPAGTHAEEWNALGEPNAPGAPAAPAAPPVAGEDAVNPTHREAWDQLTKGARQMARDLGPSASTLPWLVRMQRETAKRAETTRKIAWGALIVGLVAILLWYLFNRKSAEETATAKAAVVAAEAPRPQYRPPFDLGRWMSMDDYLAEVGHLPPRPRDVTEDEAATLRLARARRG